MLEELFVETAGNYAGDAALISGSWAEIEKNYSGRKRFYHSLAHLENLLQQLLPVKPEIRNWDAVVFALYYHDAVYDTLKSDNEEKSAGLAEKRLKQLAVPDGIIALTKRHILATKSHLPSDDGDTNLFTDADLSILGQDWETYSAYCKNVRKEYAIYPDLVYIPGRKKVLKHFLSMDRIFKTGPFYDRYEAQAEKNLNKELDLL